METIRRYGHKPFSIALLHGGPGAAGDMKPVAEYLSADFGLLELLQTAGSVKGQLEELKGQLWASATLPVILAGHSWGAWLGFLLTAKYPGLVKKLILIAAPAFEEKYNKNLMSIRLSRLKPQQREEAEHLIRRIQCEKAGSEDFRQFGKLMQRADSYDHCTPDDDLPGLNMDIFQTVWAEASRLRQTGELLDLAAKIKIPVVAIHGHYDPHPAEGVEEPLSGRLPDFKMVTIEKCGHKPWLEKWAKDIFFNILGEELKHGR